MSSMGMAGQTAKVVDFTRATEATPEVTAAIEAAFTYQPWDDLQTARGTNIRNACAAAVAAIVANAPPSPDRSSAIRLIRQARMEANSAITHNGRY